MGSAFYGERLRSFVYYVVVGYLVVGGDCVQLSLVIGCTLVKTPVVLHPNDRTYIK